MEFKRVVKYGVHEALHNLNDITKKSYEPYLVFIAIFFTPSSTMWI
jgi:hypothetical protein